MKEAFVPISTDTTRDSTYRSCRYREHCCYGLIGKRQSPAHDEPSKWHYHDTDEKSWKFFLKSIIGFTREYLHHCHPEEHEGKDDIHEITHQYPDIDEVGPKSEKVTHSPIGREEPTSEDNRRSEEESNKSEDKIQYLDYRTDDIRITLRLSCWSTLSEGIACCEDQSEKEKLLERNFSKESCDVWREEFHIILFHWQRAGGYEVLLYRHLVGA